MSSYLEKLLHSDALREPTLRKAVEAFGPAKGSRGLDAGCGAGLQCRLLAEEIGPEGQVTGIDLSSEFVDYGRERIERDGLSGRIDLVQGRIEELPFENDAFDWVWSADCVGYGPWEPRPMLEELRRVLRPGGRLALLAWSSERLLPGYPGLEARLGATSPGLAPFSEALEPERHFLRISGKLRSLGFTDLCAYAFAGSVHAPMDETHTVAMRELFDMRWQGAEKELSPEDRNAFERLCRPESPDFLPDQPDYYAVFTYSMFCGTAP